MREVIALATDKTTGGYRIVERELAEKWWESEERRGEVVEVMSVVEFLRRLKRPERLGAVRAYVVGLDKLLALSRDRENTSTWIHGILKDGRRRVIGCTVRIVVETMIEVPDHGLHVVLRDPGEEKCQKGETCPLSLIFGTVQPQEGGWAFATYTVS